MEFAPTIDESHNRKSRVKRCGVIAVKYMFDVPHILVVRGAISHIWSLPKGCINEGESELACAIRETVEETGLVMPITEQHVKVIINHNVYYVILVTQHGKFRIQDKNEVDKVHWMSLPELRTVECNKDLRSILQFPQKKFTFHLQLDELLGLNTSLNLDSFYKHSITPNKVVQKREPIHYYPLRQYKLFESPSFHTIAFGVQEG